MRWKEYEITAMKRALALAARGRGAVEPNPMVGAVIVRNGRPIAEGCHRRFGGPHAEVEALAKAGRRARGAQVFVTLEPCCHHGKTPPCTDALIKAGVKRVVIAMRDPFAKVRGRGAGRLRRAGVAVETGLLGDEARALNAPYIRLRTLGLPYVIAKYAMTLDGSIATASGDSRWISSEKSRRRVHRLRGRMDAIVTGIGTALSDDPLLTARPEGRRVAARVVMDSRARLPLGSKLVRTAADAPLMVAVTAAAPRRRTAALEKAGAEVLVLPGDKRVDVKALTVELGRREMTNVLIEGGAGILGSFFAARLVNEVEVFVAPKLVGEGIQPIGGWALETIQEAALLEGAKATRIGPDIVVTGRVIYKGK
jgi:diaminohydroxyphosphoribosylaminopyrimidine deaminase/5-amino-6-(5-phosphoribosylamino)uracil reductase